MSDKYELVVGLEVHIQLNTKSKMFCGCSNTPDDTKPNSVVCPVCFGMPGMLPVANKEAIRKTLTLGMALESNLNDCWNFERKNYFYPDLPKGYQISSSINPPVIGGHLTVTDGDKELDVRIHHIHLEEDAGKLIHDKHEGYSLVDLNRAGTPLIELVTEPDIRNPREAKLFLKEMQLLVRTLGISSADMESGHLRCDANVSVHKPGTPLGKKVEVKNLNSFNMVEKAINFESKRQTELLEAGHPVIQETRGWNDGKGITEGQRTKEELQDYRYMPEPDIPPIIRSGIPEFSDNNLLKDQELLPQAKRQRLRRYGVEGKVRDEFVRNKTLFDIFLGLLQYTDKPTEIMSIAQFIYDPVLRIANEKNIPLEDIHLDSREIWEAFNLIADKKLTHHLFKISLPDLLTGKQSLRSLIAQSASSEINIDDIISRVLNENAQAVTQWKAGDQKVFGFLVGQVMAKSKGAADPRLVNEKLRDMLSK